MAKIRSSEAEKIPKKRGRKKKDVSDTAGSVATRRRDPDYMKSRHHDSSSAHFISHIHGISKFGRKYAIGNRYDPPSKEFCDLLIPSLSKIDEKEIIDSSDMKKRLIDLSENAPAFSRALKGLRFGEFGEIVEWLFQSGIIDYERQWNTKSGHGLALWRSANVDEVEQVLKSRPSYRNGKIIKDNPTDCASQETVEKIGKPTKCCENPHPVRSKKTGKRKCKNCGRKLKRKKKKNQEW